MTVYTIIANSTCTKDTMHVEDKTKHEIKAMTDKTVATTKKQKEGP